MRGTERVAASDCDAAVRVLVDLVVRPHYLPAKVTNYSLFGVSPRSGLGDWIIHYNAVDRLGLHMRIHRFLT